MSVKLKLLQKKMNEQNTSSTKILLLILEKLQIPSCKFSYADNYPPVNFRQIATLLNMFTVKSHKYNDNNIDLNSNFKILYK